MPESCHVISHVPSLLYICSRLFCQVNIGTEDLPPRRLHPLQSGPFQTWSCFFPNISTPTNPSQTLKLPTRHQSSDDEAEEHQLCQNPHTINFLNKSEELLPVASHLQHGVQQAWQDGQSLFLSPSPLLERYMLTWLD